jgi:hypothetical protein
MAAALAGPVRELEGDAAIARTAHVTRAREAEDVPARNLEEVWLVRAGPRLGRGLLDGTGCQRRAKQRHANEATLKGHEKTESIIG